MANIYQVEIYETSAYIYLRQPNGTILECKQCSVSTAQKFISSNGLGFMLDDGECKTYIS